LPRGRTLFEIENNKNRDESGINSRKGAEQKLFFLPNLTYYGKIH